MLGNQPFDEQNCRTDTAEELRMMTAPLQLLPAEAQCVARTLADDRLGLALIDFAFAAPLVLSLFDGQEITDAAVFTIRDNRDLTQLFAGGLAARCNVYSVARPI